MAAEEAANAEPVPTDAGPVEEKPKDEKPKEIKKVSKPDDALLKQRLQEQDDKLVDKQARLEQIKATVDTRNQPTENAEFTAARSKFNVVRAESRRLLQEKRSIYDQISSADELKKQQQDLTQRLKAELQFFSVEDIERKIKALEMQQQTTSTSVKEDKKIIEDIKRLAANKPMIKQFDEAQESLRGVKEHHNELYTQLKAKNAELNSSKEEEEKWRAEMDAAKAKEDAKRSDLPALYKERDQLRKEIGEIRDEVRRIRDEHNEQRKEWFAYTKAIREQKQKEWEARNAAREAEREAWRLAKEEEEAKRDPWEEEKYLCEQLISYVEKYLPKAAVEVEAKKEVSPEEAPKGTKVLKRDDDDDYLAALKSKKGKRKGGTAGPGGGAAAPHKPKPTKLSHSVDSLASFAKLGFTAPASSDDCPALHTELLAKREWLKTAPPKKKKEKKEEKAEEKEEKEEEKEEEAAEGASASGEAPAFDEAADLKKKQEDLARKAKEAAAVEEERVRKMQELEASGKKAAGGLHKFDASEVDVHGGDATADDLMDAFGFGDVGEGGGDEEEAPGPAPAAAEAAANGSSELVTIQATSESTVKVGLHLGGEAAGEAPAAGAAAPAFDEAADLKKKQEDLARKAKEAAAVEEERVRKMQELEASGKKAAGGLHKFDASEVDVHGGDATADDLMEAFGF